MATDDPQDPTLAGRRSANDLRYSFFFWGLLVIGSAATLSGALRLSPLGTLGGLMVGAAAFSVRRAGRLRRDEIGRQYLGAYLHELGWFGLGFALVIGGAYVGHLG